MQLAQMLEIQPGVTAIIGAGGKTTLLLAMAAELSARARVIVCTTTKILPPQTMPVLLDDAAWCAPELLRASGAVCLGQRAACGKLAAPPVFMTQMAQWADYVLVEADGAKRLPAKAHAAQEPVIPPEAGQTIEVFGLSALGQPVDAAVHRAGLYAAHLGVSPQTILTPGLAAAHLSWEGLSTRVLLNQADVPQGRALARQMAARLDVPVCMASLREGWAECLY